ncbi:hypothetical protein ABZ470_39710 [Streptosporangium sp. NPDC020072]|uniref:hypothetical protein n=1 Tax=Streptosporangium sp. NPDC020072 TaxID=3154788 RepID=UPI00341258F2
MTNTSTVSGTPAQAVDLSKLTLADNLRAALEHLTAAGFVPARPATDHITWRLTLTHPTRKHRVGLWIDPGDGELIGLHRPKAARSPEVEVWDDTSRALALLAEMAGTTPQATAQPEPEVAPKPEATPKPESKKEAAPAPKKKPTPPAATRPRRTAKKKEV